jgi:site-specific DNA-methyltransferase (adenine-specific)|nr:MAG TPA: adenine-specific methyltransferase [Caudoviricetes sp.]
MESNKIYNEDCLEGMKRIPDNSVDCILTDPPYMYLKNQKLDRPFDEIAFFKECKRVLKKDSFIVLFGRGTSFYRWNCILADMGFTFKEEIIWDKINTTSPLLPLSRKHETISIHSIGRKTILRSKVPYEEIRINDDSKVVGDAKRIVSYIRNNDIDVLKKEIDNGLIYNRKRTHKTHVSTQSGFCSCNEAISCINSIKNGCNERDIISVLRDHYSAIHPTQKPVRLIERLLAIISCEGDIILDPFSGSASTAIACINTKRNYIGFEIDKEYYDLSIKRINNL